MIVLMARPTDPLTMDQYRWAIEARINRLIKGMDPTEAVMLLSVTEDQEGLITGDPKTAAEILAWESETLVNKSGMLMEDWPIPAGKIKQLLEPTLEQMVEETLTVFLGRLYGQ